MNKNFNIQLFAENLNTTATMSKEMKTFYEKRLIDQAEPRLVHDQFADYYPVPQNGGKTIEFRKYDSLPKASTPLTEGVTPNGQALNVTTITSDLHQYGGWTPLTDVLQMTAIDNNVVQATRVLASQAGRTMDSITRDVLAGGTNVIYAPKLTADGTETAVASRKALDKTCTLTPKLFFQAAAQLGAMNADPIGDSYIAIIHPYAAYDLKTSKEFIEVHKYADPDTMFRGEIGKLGNIRFIETSEAKIWKDSTCPDGLAVLQNSRTRTAYWSGGISLGMVSTHRLASWEFHCFSTASAAFHKVLRSAYDRGAFAGSRISLWTIPRFSG